MQVHLEELVKGGSYKQKGHARAVERVKASPAPIHLCPNSDFPSGQEEGRSCPKLVSKAASLPRLS